MTEDEAFIRAVVDGPGDDTPRLVYADWLDDRSDPRGPYLRAETEWAKPWREGNRPVDDPKQRAMADGLDPVWVARVSRPPLGVSCDHVRFTESGPLLRSADIDGVEQRLGGRFAANYRAFLLNYNGGVPDPSHLPYPDSVGWDDMDLEIGTFYTASRRGETPLEGAGQRWFEIESERDFLDVLFETGGGEGPNPLIVGMVPFAHTLHDLGYLLIGIRENNLGKVYHFRDYCHHSDDPDHLADYTATFAEFLIRLRPERGT
jgi:uncharacterized protein (TIGR02996 family)